jgi:serine/threonine protein kinase
VKHLFLQIVNGVKDLRLHDKHPREIKLANILLKPIKLPDTSNEKNYRVKLTYLNKIANFTYDPKSLHVMPPEVLYRGYTVCEKVDVW